MLEVLPGMRLKFSPFRETKPAYVLCSKVVGVMPVYDSDKVRLEKLQLDGEVNHVTDAVDPFPKSIRKNETCS